MNSQQRGLSQVGRASYSPKSCDYPGSPYLGGSGAGGASSGVPAGVGVGATSSPASVAIPSHLKSHHMPPEPPIHQNNPLTAAHSLGHHFHHPPHSRLISSPQSRGSPLAVSHGLEASLDPPAAAMAAKSAALPFSGPSDLLPGMPPVGAGLGEWTGERQRELDEARARTTQMEKTMRWWSDCTANWREKWAKVRNERNKAREEVRALRQALEKTRREVDEFRAQRQPERGENGRQEQSAALSDGDGLLSPAPSNGHGEGPNCVEDTLGGIKRISLTGSESSNVSAGAAGGANVEEALRARLTVEREEKARLLRRLDHLQTELAQARTAASQETAETAAKAAAKDGEAAQVEELRRELERLQQENAAEWAHRDRLESEKLALERETRRLRSRLDEVEKAASSSSASHEQSCSPGLPTNQSPGPGSARNSLEADAAYRLLLQEHEEKDKEVNELRRVCGRQRRQIEESGAELEHANRRIDQYEAEVRKLRSRVDILKRDLTLVENELDTQTTACRRMCRSNEELTQQLTSLQVQLENVHHRYQTEGESPRRCQSESDKDPRSAPLHHYPKAPQMIEDFEDEDEDELRLPNTVLIDNQGLRSGGESGLHFPSVEATAHYLAGEPCILSSACVSDTVSQDESDIPYDPDEQVTPDGSG